MCRVGAPVCRVTVVTVCRVGAHGVGLVHLCAGLLWLLCAGLAHGIDVMV